MTKPGTFSRLAAVLLSVLMTCVSIAQRQDISGGAGVLVASADVEAKLGKGIFTPVQSKPHLNKAPEKRTVVRAHPRTNTAGRRQQCRGSCQTYGLRLFR